MATGRIGTNTVLTTRWSKAPAGGTTSLSGLDDNSVSLVYSVGYEQVYRNGVLLSRGNDYTATNGTTITLIDATITGDIIEVFANATIPLTDTYSQSVANGKFINNTLTTTTGDIIYASAANTPARLGIGSTDQVLKVSGGVPAWGAASGGMTLISTTTLTGASISLTSIPGTYKNLQLVVRNWIPVNDNKGLLLRFNGDSGAGRHTQQKVFEASAQTFGGTYVDTGYATDNTTNSGIVVLNFTDYTNTATWKYCEIISFVSNETTVTSYNYRKIFGAYNQTGAITSLTLFPETGNFNAGTALLYGVA